MNRSIFAGIERTLAQSHEAIELSVQIRAELARLLERRWRSSIDS